MNVVLLIIEIYLLIGVVAALVISRIDALGPYPRPWPNTKSGWAFAGLTIFAWLPLFVIVVCKKITEHLDG